MKRLNVFLISILCAVVIAVGGIALYVNWNAIKGTIDDSKYYTSIDLQNSYDKGYDDGCKSETELTAEVAYYKTLVDEYEIVVATLNSEIASLQLTNNSLNASIEDKQEEISSLTNQIANLQALSSQLQTTNALNLETINALNAQIQTLNTQISEMTLQVQNNSNIVSSLNNKIADLEQSIAYYETYMSQLESDTQVVATFEFDGSVYNIQIVNKNSIVSVVNPSSSETVIFNGWTVDGEMIDLSTYEVTTNTRFVADVTYKYVATFNVDNETYETQYIISNSFVDTPVSPVKDGYEFDGWTINGVDVVDVGTYAITTNTTFIAKFTELHTVTFIYEDETVGSYSVRNGSIATIPTFEENETAVFNGWKVNDIFVDVSTYKITASTVFVADLTYTNTVNFYVDNEVYDTQEILYGNYATLPNCPEKDGYMFLGWSLDEATLITSLDEQLISSNTNFFALFIEASDIMYYGDKIGSFGLWGVDCVVTFDYGWLPIGLDIDLKCDGARYYWSIKDSYIYNNCINFSLSGSTRFAGCTARFNIYGCAVFTIDVLEDRVSSSLTLDYFSLTNATQQYSYIQFLKADTDQSYDDFESVFPSNYSILLSTGFYPNSPTDSVTIELPQDNTLADGYIIEWYLYEADPTIVPKDISYSDMTLIGTSDTVSSYEFKHNSSCMTYVVARYVKV